MEIIKPLVEQVETMFLLLQGLKTMVCKQWQYLSQLQDNSITQTYIEGLINDEQEMEKHQAIKEKNLILFDIMINNF